jgi:hypothetical protein
MPSLFNKTEILSIMSFLLNSIIAVSSFFNLQEVYHAFEKFVKTTC